jgi:hypothetical protein
MGAPSSSRRGGGGGTGPSSGPGYGSPSLKKLEDILKGDLSPEIIKAKKKSEENILSQFVKKVGKSVITGILIGALSAVPVIGPLVIPLYNAYKFGISGKKVLDAYREAKKDKEGAALKAGEKEVVKFVAGEITGAAVEQAAGLVGEGVKTMAEKSGATGEIAKNTHVDSEILAEMLRGSVENGIKEGFDAISDFIVEKSV